MKTILRQPTDPAPCIRCARPDDYPAIVELLDLCFSDEGPDIGGTPDTLESIAELQAAGHQLLVAEKENVVVGFVSVHPGVRAAFRLAVLPACRKLGYGRALMDAAENYARASGWSELLVAALKSKSHLVGYYKGLGYLDEGREEVMGTYYGYRGPETPLNVLRKPIACT
jgi:ribosomal protein S18 acetylase RimI-like enzyme